MSGSGSLYGLLEAACRRCLAGGPIRDWLNGQGRDKEWVDYHHRAAVELAEEVLKPAQSGLFRQARLAAHLVEAYIPEDLSYETEVLGHCPGWQEFVAVCDLADRVDSFLAVLEQNATAGHLARDVRDNLDLLLVLADWCEENHRAAVADEARHLYRFVRSM